MSYKSILLLALFISANAFAQLNSTLPNIHSHNDYLQKKPLFAALDAGAKSIEIDLHLKNDSLFVAHSKREIRSTNTLENVYILPLQKYLSENPTRNKFHLMIDIKSEAISTLKTLEECLKNYPDIFSENGIQVVISGNRPKPENYNDYANFIWFDGREPADVDEPGGEKIAMISQNLSKFTPWRGQGTIPAKEKSELIKFVNDSHKKNKPVRLWNSGDNETMYQFLCEIGVDYINTDRPETVRTWLKNFNPDKNKRQ